MTIFLRCSLIVIVEKYWDIKEMRRRKSWHCRLRLWRLTGIAEQHQSPEGPWEQSSPDNYQQAIMGFSPQTAIAQQTWYMISLEITCLCQGLSQKKKKTWKMSATCPPNAMLHAAIIMNINQNTAQKPVCVVQPTAGVLAIFVTFPSSLKSHRGPHWLKKTLSKYVELFFLYFIFFLKVTKRVQCVRNH